MQLLFLKEKRLLVQVSTRWEHSLFYILCSFTKPEQCHGNMAIVDFLISPWALLALPIVFYILPYIKNKALVDIPAPFPAAFTNLWLMYQARRGRRYQVVDEAHKKYGKFVRLQPHHVSIADASAINVVYGHGNGFLKR